MLLWLIIFCEIGFWIVSVSGLTVRYIFKKPKLGSALLLCVPLLDILLLLATAIDLRAGSTAEFAHGLAAVYLGFTVVFGRSVIASADGYFAHKFDNQPKPLKRYGWDYTKNEWHQWIKGILASGIACILLYTSIWFVNDHNKTQALNEWFYILASLMLFWFTFGPLWYTLFRKKPPKAA